MGQGYKNTKLKWTIYLIYPFLNLDIIDISTVKNNFESFKLLQYP